jgi:hypothetical protein
VATVVLRLGVCPDIVPNFVELDWPTTYGAVRMHGPAIVEVVDDVADLGRPLAFGTDGAPCTFRRVIL